MARVTIAGASGLIGSALSQHLPALGYDVAILKRGHEWDPAAGILNQSLLSGSDFIINLCGEGIADGRWTREKKKRIRESRVKSTALIADAAAAASTSGVTLLNASAIGVYGNRGDSHLKESSSPGSGFLAEVCTEWEAAATAAGQAGVRVVLLRFAVVLSKNGGALAGMIRPFRCGLGGQLGPGKQYMSWITLNDAVRAIAHCMSNTSIEGPVNVCSPNPVTNSTFTAALASELRRPAFARVPALILRAMFGEIADEALLSSQRAIPEKLLNSGFEFQYSSIHEGLRAVLGL